MPSASFFWTLSSPGDIAFFFLMGIVGDVKLPHLYSHPFPVLSAFLLCLHLRADVRTHCLILWLCLTYCSACIFYIVAFQSPRFMFPVSFLMRGMQNCTAWACRGLSLKPSYSCYYHHLFVYEPYCVLSFVFVFCVCLTFHVAAGAWVKALTLWGRHLTEGAIAPAPYFQLLFTK